MTFPKLFDTLTRFSRKLTILPRGQIGVLLNRLILTDPKSQIQTFKANNGLIYRSDLRSYTENYVPWTGEYEGKTLDMILPMIPKDKNILDIGGNVGYWTINLGNILTEKKVYTFEPVKSNYSRILEHLELNHMQDKVQVFNIGLSDKAGKANFDYTPNDKNNKAETFNAWLQESDNGVCDIHTLDSIIDSNTISDIGFVKIDVEGFEIKCFKGAIETFKTNRPIIYGEFTPAPINRVGDKPLDIYNLLSDYTFFQEKSNQLFIELEDGELFKRDLLIIPNELKIELTNKFKQFFVLKS
jgi:FkbM family methyltransferase